jgi:glycogen(starch) synthase
VADGHQVHVVANGTPDAQGTSVDEGVLVHRAVVPTTTGGSWIGEVALANDALAAAALPLLSSDAFDVVHAHDWMVAQVTREVLAAASLPLVATMHATERGRHQGHLPGPLNRRIDAIEHDLARSATQVIVCSQSMAAHTFTHLRVPRAKVTVVPNGVDRDVVITPAEVARWRMELAPQGGHLVLYVGRLEHEKGIHVLLEAVRGLQSDDRLVCLGIAGVGTKGMELRALAGALEDGTVTFAGFVDPQRVPALLAAADVVAVPSLYEPYGLVALESMSVATPVVASAIGGLSELIEHDRNGLLVQPDDVDGLAAALDRVATDPKLARRLADGGMRTVKASSWAAAAARTVAVYETACGR